MNEASLWESDVMASSRPADLQKLMIRLVRDIESLYGPSRLTSLVGFSRLIPANLGMAKADAMANSFNDWLFRVTKRAVALAERRATEVVKATADYVISSGGATGRTFSTSAIEQQFKDRVAKYIESDASDLRPFIQTAVYQWISQKAPIQSLRDALAEIVQRASWQSARTVRTEMQNAYVLLVKSSAARDGQSVVERVITPSACDECKRRAGDHPANDPDAYWTHPNCACTFVLKGEIKMPVIKMLEVEFSGITEDTPSEDGLVYQDGLLFRSGEYMDKSFSITPEEMRRAAADFKPVPIDIEHMSTVFDGKLGHLVKVWVEEDGAVLRGRVALQPWIKKALGDSPIKVSTTWDRANKTLSRLALVNNPRVSDAVLMVAFSESPLASPKQENIGMSAVNGFWSAFMDRIFGEGGSGESQTADAGKGATFAGPQGQNAPVVGQSAPPPSESTKAGFESSAEFAAMSAELKRVREDGFNSRVDGLVAAHVQSGQVFPAEQEALKQTLKQALVDDHAHPQEVAFSVGTEQRKGGRFDSLVASLQQRPKHLLAGELVDSGGNLTALFAKEKSEPLPGLSDQRRKELLGASSLGEIVLKIHKGEQQRP